MKPADKIIDLINKSDVATSPDANQRILADALKHLDKLKRNKLAPDQPNIWRTIMKSRISKLAAAAVVMIACVIGLSLWRTTGSGIALADVLTRIEQVTSYRYQVSSTNTKQQMNGIRTSTVLVSKEHGLKRIITKVDPNEVKSTRGKYAVGDEWYILLQSNSIVILSHEKKTYDRFIYDGVKLDFYKEEYNDPRTIIKQILSCEHKSLGQSDIDGITVEGFQTTDLAYGGGFFGQADRKGEPEKVDVKLWVDVDTFLPVRLQQDIITKKGKRKYDVSHDFRWNVIVNPDDFEPHIPEDYRSPVGDIVIRPFNEENAIKGFRLWVDLIGDYPVILEMGAFREEVKRRIVSDPNSYKELSDEERTMETNEGLSIAAPAFFYKTLVGENKDPAYYGETVGPEDADKVLLRWKQDDGQYRVIFGDLRAKTITAEELSELEKLSSK